MIEFLKLIVCLLLMLTLFRCGDHLIARNVQGTMSYKIIRYIALIAVIVLVAILARAITDGHFPN
jgi:hypothetical protein